MPYIKPVLHIFEMYSLVQLIDIEFYSDSVATLLRIELSNNNRKNKSHQKETYGPENTLNAHFFFWLKCLYTFHFETH